MPRDSSSRRRPNSLASGSFTVQESTNASAAGLGGLTATATITVNPPPGPTATFSNNGPIIEGSTATVVFSNQQDSLVTKNPGYRYSYDFGDNGIFEIKNSSKPSAVVPLSYLLTPGPHVIHGRITDREGNYTDYTTTIWVEASVPTVTLRTPFTTVVPGEPVPFAIHVNDNSSSAERGNFTYTIWFGDGTSKTFTGRNSVVVTHVYSECGTYCVSVTATDKYGNSNNSNMQTINVVPVAVEADPFCFSKTALYVGGTDGNDTFDFQSASGGISVTVNGDYEGIFNTKRADHRLR